MKCLRILAGMMSVLVLGGIEVLGQARAPGSTVIDVINYEVKVEVQPDRSFLEGEAKVEFLVLEEALAVPFSFNKQLTLLEVYDEEDVSYSLRTDDFATSRIRVQSPDPLREGARKTLTFRFEGLLEEDEYAFLDVASSLKAVIDRDGALLLTEGYWFPSHRLALDPATVTMRVTVPLGFSVVAPGTLDPIETVGLSEVFTWRTGDPITQVPVIVARYYRVEYERDAAPLTFYMPEDSDRSMADFADLVNDVVDFYSDWLGPAPFPGLTLTQVRNSQLGMPTSKALILLEPKLVNAHTLPVLEIAKRVALQWWGHSVHIQRSMDAWLADGFAQFSALKYIESKDPKQFEAELAKHAIDALKYQDTAPIINGLDLEVGSARYQSIVGSKGAWVLYMLGQLVTPEKLDDILYQFYTKYAGQTASIPNFVQMMGDVTGDNYAWFFIQWVESVGVPEFRVDYTISRVQAGGYKIRGQVKQNIELFRMPLDILIETKGQPEEKNLMVNGKTTSFQFDSETLPLKFDIDPKGKILMDSERMRIAVLIAIGDEFRETGEFVSAIEEYEKAVSLNARNSLAHYRLGETFFLQHSYSNAANSMRDSLNGDLKPDWVETWAHIHLGKVYDILGQRQRAKAEYQKAINSGVDYNGAQSEAERYLAEPYTKPSGVIG
jgi:hypothetical protein